MGSVRFDDPVAEGKSCTRAAGGKPPRVPNELKKRSLFVEYAIVRT
jgi:hypothetical protein